MKKLDKSRFRIGKTYITTTDLTQTIKKIDLAVKNRWNKYICVSNFRMVRYANAKGNEEYLALMNNSYMNLPDGMPLVWCAKIWGLKYTKCTSGPELFDTMLKSSDKTKHFLLGDTEDTLNAIKKKYTTQYNTKIVGCISPPFIDVNKYDYTNIAEKINESKADIVWIAMRAPKQDIFSQHISPLLDSAICIGVGRAFRISVGTVKQAPQSVRAFGFSGFSSRRVSFLKTLEWYLQSSVLLLFYFCDIIYNRIRQKKYYE